MKRQPGPVPGDLAASVAALARESTADGAGLTQLADRLPQSSPRQRAAEDWFLDCVAQLALDGRHAYAFPADAVLSVRQQVRVAVETAGLSEDQRERILVLATDAAMDVLFDEVHAPRGLRRH